MSSLNSVPFNTPVFLLCLLARCSLLQLWKDLPTIQQGNEISAPLKPQDLEQVSNLGHNCLRATSPDNQGASRPRLFGIDSSQTQTANVNENKDISINLPTLAPIREHKTLPNGGKV
ncbi:hypothetical protein DSO57_1023969 [Entomophthora muscae]|uniref:Uncharacterized protein n=1 Tax=Entomophthora muscae TaxID=34485 RepID=A0ACC2S4K4_9FUNG|nr:hypothetical protein DSO57_1023969 [Entomophthora muscae]